MLMFVGPEALATPPGSTDVASFLGHFRGCAFASTATGRRRRAGHRRNW